MRVPVWLASVIALVLGAGLAVQSRINGELGQRLNDGFTAATISFSVGTVILLVALAVSPTGRRGLGRVFSALRDRSLAWWYVLGGAAGALVILAQGLTAAILGVALFTVAIVAGQTISGLVLDRIGLGAGGRRALSASRITGAGVVIVAVVWAVSGEFVDAVPVWMLLLPFLAGLGLGWQQAVNGEVRVVASSALAATFVSFAVGTVLLVIATIIHSSFVGWPTALPTDWWLYLGGAIGCVFIASAALIVRITGVLLLGLATIAGQLLAALTIDLAFPAPTHVVVWSTVAGTLLAVVGVVVAGVQWPQSERSTQSRTVR